MSISRFFKSRSLTVTSSLVLSFLFLIMIGTIIVLSYFQQRQSYYEQFNMYGTSFEAQVNVNHDLIETSASKIARQEGSSDNAFTILKRQLNAMVGGSSVTNAYLLAPEKIERDGKSYLVNIQANSELDAVGWQPGSEYLLPPSFQESLTQAIQTGSAITEPFKDEVGEWITYISPIKDQSGNLTAIFCIDFNYRDVEDKVDEIFWTNVGGAIFFTAIAILIVVILIRITLRPLRKLAELSKLAAQGDLTVTVPVTSRNEIGQAAAAFNDMIGSLRDLASSIRTTSSEVSESAANLQESAGQTAEATQEIAESIQTVAAGSDTQLKSSQECMQAMSEMAAGIQRIAESSSLVSDLAADTSANAIAGDTVVSDALRQMQAIESNLGSSVASMHELQQLSSRIGEIMALISDVANQTNLLALNASIEAARAGEHGKGFAVVAQEIRKLAERSRSSSEQIDTILQGIHERTSAAVTSLEQTMLEARTGTVVAAEAGTAFKSIVGAIQQVTGQVQEVSAAAEQMSASSEEIAASLEELERIAAFSSQETERVAASSEEQLAAMEEVASSSEQLRQLANGLNGAIGRFRV